MAKKDNHSNIDQLLLEELQLIFDNVPSKIWYKDDQNTILRLNKSAANSMNMPREDAEGANTYDLFPDMAKKYHDDDLEVINSNTPKLGIIEEYVPKDGEKGWVRTDKVPYVDRTTGDKRVLVIAQDITKEKRADILIKESEKRFQLAVEATRDGIWDWPDITKDDQYWSPQWKALLGYKPDELKAAHSTFCSLLHPDDVKSCKEVSQESIENASTFDIEYRLKTKSGEYKWFQGKGSVIRNSETNITRMIGSIIDIHERKILEQEKEELIDKLTRVNEELTQFSYIASHDLREPLRTISSLSNIVKENNIDNFDLKTEEYLNHIINAAYRMDSMVSDLLEYAKIENHADTIRNVDCNKSLDDALNNLNELINEKEAQITYGALPIIHTNPQRLIRVLQNLIGNALIHSGHKPEIHIDLEIHDEQECIYVQDNGSGIKKEYIDKVFNPFFSLEPKFQNSGTGIGLSICRKIVEQYGGKIWVESKPNKGSKFIFSLPRSKYL